MSGSTMKPAESVIKSVNIRKTKRVSRLGTWQEHLLSVEATIDFELWFDECEDWIMPKGEYEAVDDSNDMHFWMDDFMNVHWLVKVAMGHIQYKVVNISDEIQKIANEKYSEHLYELELENE